MRAWLTPDSTELDENRLGRNICIPGGFFRYIMGALDELTKAYRWEEFGDTTAQEMADYFRDVVDEMMEGESCMIGQISAFCRGLAVPDKWQGLNGKKLVKADYPELAAVVPTDWIVDGGNNIQLPNMNGGYGLVASGSQNGNTVVTGELSGEFEHTLTESEMPRHSHSAQTLAQSNLFVSPGEAPAIFLLGTSVTGQTGGDQPHNNMPPHLGVRFAIYVGR